MRTMEGAGLLRPHGKPEQRFWLVVSNWLSLAVVTIRDLIQQMEDLCVSPSNTFKSNKYIIKRKGGRESKGGREEETEEGRVAGRGGREGGDVASEIKFTSLTNLSWC